MSKRQSVDNKDDEYDYKRDLLYDDGYYSNEPFEVKEAENRDLVYTIAQLQETSHPVTPDTASNIIESLGTNYKTMIPRVTQPETHDKKKTLYDFGVTSSVSNNKHDMYIHNGKWSYASNNEPFNIGSICNLYEIPKKIFDFIYVVISDFAEQFDAARSGPISERIESIQCLQALQIIVTLLHTYRVSIVGMGGSGKTTLLKRIIQYYSTIMKKSHVEYYIAITAPTHESLKVLSTTIKKHLDDNNIDIEENMFTGTIHSFLGITPSLDTFDEWKKYYTQKTKRARQRFDTIITRFERTSLLVIDEGSLLSFGYISNVLSYLYQHLIDTNIRYANKKTDSFGNKCVLIVGDPLQLPPVCGQLAYSSPHIKLFKTFVLSGQLRTSNKEFAAMQAEIRFGTITDSCRKFLNEKLISRSELNKMEPNKYILLAYTNKDVRAQHSIVLSYYEEKQHKERFTHRTVVYEKIWKNTQGSDEAVIEPSDITDEKTPTTESVKAVYRYIDGKKEHFKRKAVMSNVILKDNDNMQFGVGCRVRLKADITNNSGKLIPEHSDAYIIDYNKHNLLGRYSHIVSPDDDLPHMYSITLVASSLFNCAIAKGVTIDNMLSYMETIYYDDIFIVHPRLYSVSSNDKACAVYNVFILPILQCNTMTVHKSQSRTFSEETFKKVVIYFTDLMASRKCCFYTGISRLETPDQLLICTAYNEPIATTHVVTNKEAIEYINSVNNTKTQ